MQKISLPQREFYWIILAALVFAACDRNYPTVQPTLPLVSTQTLTPSPSPIPSSTPTTIPLAAQVNGEGILLAEYEIEKKQLQEASQASGLAPSSEKQSWLALNHLIDETLLAQAAFQAGFTLDQPALQNRLDQLARQMGSNAALATWQNRLGYSPDLFRQVLRRSIAAVWQRDQILGSVPLRAEQVRARQILMLDLDEAKKVVDQLGQSEAGGSNGADFSTLATQYDPYTGGDLGWFPHGYLTQPAVEEAAFNLQPGGTSSLVKTNLGYHLLQVVARQNDRLLTLDARRALQRKALEDWLLQRRSQSKILISIKLPPKTTPTPNQAASPTYTVQAGESFASIASQFGVTSEELVQANSQMVTSTAITPEILAEGVELLIPGRVGIQGKVAVETIAQGASLESLAHLYQSPVELLARLNRVTSPAELYSGSDLILLEGQQAGWTRRLFPLTPGQSLLEFSAAQELNPWLVLLANQAGSTSQLLPGETLFVPTREEVQDPGPLAPSIKSFSIDPLPLVQGNTVVIRVQTVQPADVTGRLDGRSLHFFEVGENEYVAIQGIHAMAEPGLTDFSLIATPSTGQPVEFEEILLLSSGNFPRDPPLTVDPQTLDKSIVQPEEQLLARVTGPATPKKWWSLPFGVPVNTTSCARSGYGNRRSYNGSPYIYFHAGLDFGLCSSPYIFAPAPGVVVFAGPLTVRGNATIIDHGWGIYSGFWHQGVIYVKVGDQLEMGQPIGEIGATGRSTGEHLHWEMWVNGVQVDPRVWLGRLFP